MSFLPRKYTRMSAACLTVAAALVHPIALVAAQRDPPVNAPTIPDVLRCLPSSPVTFGERTGTIPFDPAAGRLTFDAGTSSFFDIPLQQASGLIGRYRQALDRETRRMNDRESLKMWTNLVDEEEEPAPGVQREARKLVSGANGRILSQVVDRIIEASAGLQQARDYAEGVRLDVRRGGGVTVGAGKGVEPAAEIAARFTFLLGANPRVEMRTTLPGHLKTRVELSLANPGIRASVSRPMSAHFSSSLAAGYEDEGEDRWLSAGLGVKF